MFFLLSLEPFCQGLFKKGMIMVVFPIWHWSKHLWFSLVLYHLSLVQVYRLCDKNFQWYGQNNIFQKTIDIEINNRLRWKMWVSFTSSQNHLCSRFEVIVFGIWIFFSVWIVCFCFCLGFFSSTILKSVCRRTVVL